MVGGRLRCLSCFFTRSAVLLLVCLLDVEASSGQRVVHKKVGDTVELSSRLPTAGVTIARWRHGGLIIADKNKNVPETHQFKGRLELNPTNFSLTVRRLTLQDSGDFRFVSEVNDEQRGNVDITLQVHEPITTQPALTFNSTWNALNESCTVLLECNSAASDGSVAYDWTVRNQTTSGPRLQYIARPQDGDIEFTCTARNFVSEKSAFKTVKCTNSTPEITTPEKSPVNTIVFLSGAGACSMIMLIVGIAVCVRHREQRRADCDSSDLTVYADISEVAIADGTLSTMTPCSVYEAIDIRVNHSVTPGPQTVYDKIQLSRLRKASESPYQELSMTGHAAQCMA